MVGLVGWVCVKLFYNGYFFLQNQLIIAALCFICYIFYQREYICISLSTIIKFTYIIAHRASLTVNSVGAISKFLQEVDLGINPPKQMFIHSIKYNICI